MTGKYKNWWNTENTYTGDQNSRHTPCCFANTPSPKQDKVQTHQILITKSSGDTLHAKLKELNERKKEQVYIDKKDKGQDCKSLRWVLKEKLVDDNKIIKARLHGRGFEEAQDFRKDSPTCSRRGLKPYYPYLSVNNKETTHIEISQKKRQHHFEFLSKNLTG